MSLLGYIGATRPTIDELLCDHEFADHKHFRETLSRMMESNPNRHPSDLLFIATEIYRSQLQCVMALDDIKREIATRERARIKKIIEHGIDNDCIKDALNLSFATELGADDAISILDAKQSADIVRAN